MTSTLRVHLNTYGSQFYGEMPVPLRVDLLNQELDVIESRDVNTQDTPEFYVQPGIYAVTATAPSGARVQQVVQVEDQDKDCELPVHEVSPHEDHEWAYLTHSGARAAPDASTLQSPVYAGSWLRAWRLIGGAYLLEPDLTNVFGRGAEHPDGVIYFPTQYVNELACLQVGGPEVPWKCVAVPPSDNTKVLVRPSSRRGAPDLDVVVSSDNLALDGLLAFLQRGDLDGAQKMEKGQAGLAERFLFSKRSDTAAAAVGGYYLLRINDLHRLHDWANNLANWFEWMADGAIIHAWQLIGEYRQEGADVMENARGRLLQAVERGFPIYTEGLRLLRDGLMLFDRRAEGDDHEISKALQQAGDYIAAADWTATTTTFTGAAPDSPSPEEQTGVPDDFGGSELLNR